MGARLVTGQTVGRAMLVTFLFVLVQETLMLRLRIGGVHPDVMVLLPILAGIVAGPARGATVGFGAGLVADLFLPTPYGLSALVGCLLGFGVGMAVVAVDRSAWWLAPLAALVGSAVYEVAFAALGALLGQQQMLHVAIVRIVVVVAGVNAILAAPALRLVDWGLPEASTEGLPSATAATVR